jgi:hypothetical protein
LRIRYGLWVTFVMMLTLAWAGGSLACDDNNGCAGHGESVTPGKGQGDGSGREHGSDTSRPRSSGKTWTVVYGYPVEDEEPEPVDPDLEPWDEECVHPFGDDDEMLEMLSSMMSPCTCNCNPCGVSMPGGVICQICPVHNPHSHCSSSKCRKVGGDCDPCQYWYSAGKDPT